MDQAVFSKIRIRFQLVLTGTHTSGLPSGAQAVTVLSQDGHDSLSSVPLHHRCHTTVLLPSWIDSVAV